MSGSDILREREASLDTLTVAVAAFLAGFLSCATATAALLAWSFSDRRACAVARSRAGRRR